MSALAVIGAAVVDEFMTVAELPVAEQSVHADSYSRATGGKAANQAAAASLSGGEPVSLLASIGQDSLGDLALADIASTGVNVSSCLRDEQPTGRSFVIVGRHGNQMVATWPGASSTLSAADVRNFLSELPTASWVSLQGEVPGAATFAELARAAGHKIVLNPSPIDQFRTAFPWNLVDVAVANKIEANALSSELAGVDTVIITQGAEGVMVRRNNTIKHFVSPAVTAVDTTGAGDAFAGVVSARLVAGADFRDAIRAALAAASISVTRRHCIPSYPSAAEIEAVIGSIHEGDK